MGKKEILFVFCIIAVILVGVVIFAISNHNELETDKEELYYKKIEEKISNEQKPYNDAENNKFKTFLSVKKYGYKLEEDRTYIYCWIQSESFFENKEGKIELSRGSSIPYKFTFKDDEIINYEVPRDGGYYSESIREIFPINVWTKFEKVYEDDSLKNNIYTQVEEYYNISRDEIIY